MTSSHNFAHHENRAHRDQKPLDELINELYIDDHKIDLEQLCLRYSTNLEAGLSSEIALQRNEIYGLNTLTPTTVRFGFLKFLRAIFGGFSLVLWFGVVLSFISAAIDSYIADEIKLDHLYLACILIAIAVLSGCLAYYQESKNSKIISSFKKAVPHYAKVTRNGQLQKILAELLTKGDLVDIKSGDRVPADIRVVESKGFKVDLSSLTGENEPQLRTPDFTSDNPLETNNLVFFSTNAIEGSCRGIVINVGDKTVVGQIVSLASHFTSGETEVAKEIQHLIRLTTGIAMVIGFLVFIAEFQSNILEALISLVGVIVACVPEGLPITVMICLRLVAKRMAQKNCLVNNLGAVETIGAASMIITDKTGTLTQNRMTVAHVWFDNKIVDAETMLGETVDEIGATGFKDLSRCATLCNIDQFDPTRSSAALINKVVVDSAEVAILRFMSSLYGSLTQFRAQNPKVAEIPFNSTNKYQVSIHSVKPAAAGPRTLLIMKGAPERIFDCCSTIMIEGREYFIDEEWRKSFYDAYATLGALGERVLGFCDLYLPAKYSDGFVFDAENPNFPLNSLRFAGLISMIDPVRPSVPAALALCRSAQIKIVMMTGDHPIAAAAVAQSMGLIPSNYQSYQPLERDSTEEIDEDQSEPPKTKSIVMHGGDLKDLTPDQLDAILEKYDTFVFARTAPRQKLILVDACQRIGAIVAVTGKNINDAPSLQKGDIGVAMGIVGSDVAKQAADMILLDDNFGTLVSGVEEGRLIYDNLKKCIDYTLTSNIPQITPYFAFAMLNVPLPVGIITILCIDLGTDLIPAISIAYELAENDMMKRKPRDPRDELVNRHLIIACARIGIIETLAGFYSYFIILAENGFLPWDLIDVRKDWDSPAVNDFVDSYGQEWTYDSRMKLQYTGQTGFFVAIVIVQCANVIVCKTRRNSFIQQGMRNWVLNFGLIFETCLAAAFTYTPGSKVGLKLYPLDWAWWFLPLPFAIFIFVFDEVRRYMIRHYVGGWVEYETYY